MLVAGTIVVISLFGLFAMGLTYLYGVALASIIAVLVVMAAAITLLPALLGFAGRADRAPAAARAAAGVRALCGPLEPRRPAAAVDRRGGRHRRAARARLPRHRAAARLPGRRQRRRGDDHAPGLRAGDAALRRGRERAARGRRARALRPSPWPRYSTRDPGIATVAPPALNPAGDTALVLANPTTSPQAAATEDTLARLRDGRLGADVVIGGRTAQAVDQASATSARLPLFIGIVAGLSLLLLLVAFRSVTVALKAAVLNLFSVAAAYGVVALLAQGGWAGQLVGIDTATPVPPFIPVIMFATLFGLSMDYEVFLLSRVREAWLRGRDTPGAVTEGLTRTAGVISAAAAIMVVVFGALALSPEVFLKLIGLGWRPRCSSTPRSCGSCSSPP